MKRFTTILCSLAFLLSGYFLANIDVSPLQHPAVQASNAPIILAPAQLPRDLQLDLAGKSDTVLIRDTVFPTILDDVLIKYRKPVKRAQRTPIIRHEPDTVPMQSKKDTLYVPSLYIIIPLDNLEETNDTTKLLAAEAAV